MDDNRWIELLPVWLLGAPLLLAVLSVLFDGTRHRAPTEAARTFGDARRSPTDPR
jgi:hypothetical protein